MRIFLYLLVVVFLISSSVNACDRCVHSSKTAYFSSGYDVSSGACTYGTLMPTRLYTAHFAAATPSIYKHGAACGACFQVRCKNPKLCTSKGTFVMVTDMNKINNQTDLVLSNRAFRAMAKPVRGADRYLLKQGIVDVEYQRVPCNYGKRNLNVRVEERSAKVEPYFLEIMPLYQGGQTEVVGIDVAQVGSSQWINMIRSDGAAWGTDKVPTGALQFRFTVTGGKKIWAKRALPANWEIQRIYDTGVQITDIAQERCDTCSNIWK
ncbi:hypothetical protein CARUB_v10018653mg [Capsella rubella]|uniref:Expansin-like EG45 domain-containing protein n=1 Tax=Capsella rubella TaxID=81985 RepID=R0H1R5_9BRAS|nr:expansin-like A3 [Capsella rubella]EOA23194.1 hypothetical protein CARUB_v10018653mg [Capsella rubella]